jgi:hypothetical protein
MLSLRPMTELEAEAMDALAREAGIDYAIGDPAHLATPGRARRDERPGSQVG